MDWSTTRVLVTGAGGFIGSHLVERLVELGARPRALVRYSSSGSWGWLESSSVRSEMEIVVGDVADVETMQRVTSGVDVVFHLAASISIPYSYQAPRAFVRANIEGTLNALNAARDAGVKRFVHTSTSETYGTAQSVPISEDHALRGQSPYAATKIGADKLAESFWHAYAVPVVTVRPFNTYGPRQSLRAVLSTIIAQALASPVIHLGALAPTRDFTFVKDTVTGFIAAAAADAAVGQVLNLGSGREISIGDLARRVIAIIGREVRVEELDARKRPSTSEVERLIADTSRLHALTGWVPTVSLDEGLARTIAWFRTARVQDATKDLAYCV